jgi:hypothetical protein
VNEAARRNAARQPLAAADVEYGFVKRFMGVFRTLLFLFVAEASPDLRQFTLPRYNAGQERLQKICSAMPEGGASIRSRGIAARQV